MYIENLPCNPFKSLRENKNSSRIEIPSDKVISYPNDFNYKRGTTTLAIRLKDCVIVCVDSRASMGSYIASNNVIKVIPCFPQTPGDKSNENVKSTVIGTMAGGAADCAFWERLVASEVICDFYSGEKFNAKTVSKKLCDYLRNYRGKGLSVGSLIAGADESGADLYMVDNDGSRVNGIVHSVGSGSTYAYGIVDSSLHMEGKKLGIEINNDNDYEKILEIIGKEKVMEIAKKALYYATHRDGASGGYIRLICVEKSGWNIIWQDDMNSLNNVMHRME